MMMMQVGPGEAAFNGSELLKHSVVIELDGTERSSEEEPTLANGREAAVSHYNFRSMPYLPLGLCTSWPAFGGERRCCMPRRVAATNFARATELRSCKATTLRKHERRMEGAARFDARM